MRTPARFVVLALVLLLAPSVLSQDGRGNGGKKGKKNKGDDLVLAIFDDPLVHRLAKGKPSESTLRLGQHQFLGFSIAKGESGYPDILLSMEVTNPDGAADLFCTPLNLQSETDFTVPTALNAIWRSVHTVGTDYVFISRTSEQYLAGVKEFQTGDSVEEFATLVCSVVGNGHGPTDYRLELDVVYDVRELVKEEQKAVKAIRKKCCAEENTCGGWHLIEQAQEGADLTDENPPFDLCHVHGNVCDEEGHLLRLNMAQYGLNCDFPAEEIVQFTRLEKLTASVNNFTGDIGEIAAQLKTLENLEEVIIAANSITGSLDNENVCELASGNLQLLNLEFNSLTGPLPACLIDETSNLKELHLDSNKLDSSIPDAFAEVSKLQHLSMSAALLTGELPSSVKGLTDLRSLDLRFNELSGPIPEELGASDTLVSVRMEVNQLSGKIPSSFATSTSLRFITMDNNSFTGLPDEWIGKQAQGNNLVEVGLALNNIKGEFPKALSREPTLAVLDLSDNKFSGNLKGGKDVFQKTFYINFARNQLTGPIPEEWKDIGFFNGAAFQGPPVFPFLDLSDNSLTGQIPTFMLDADNLAPEVVSFQAIGLGGNQLECPEDRVEHIVGIEQLCGSG